MNGDHMPLDKASEVSEVFKAIKAPDKPNVKMFGDKPFQLLQTIVVREDLERILLEVEMKRFVSPLGIITFFGGEEFRIETIKEPIHPRFLDEKGNYAGPMRLDYFMTVRVYDLVMDDIAKFANNSCKHCDSKGYYRLHEVPVLNHKDKAGNVVNKSNLDMAQIKRQDEMHYRILDALKKQIELETDPAKLDEIRGQLSKAEENINNWNKQKTSFINDVLCKCAESRYLKKYPNCFVDTKHLGHWIRIDIIEFENKPSTMEVDKSHFKFDTLDPMLKAIVVGDCKRLNRPLPEWITLEEIDNLKARQEIEAKGDQSPTLDPADPIAMVEGKIQGVEIVPE